MGWLGQYTSATTMEAAVAFGIAANKGQRIKSFDLIIFRAIPYIYTRVRQCGQRSHTEMCISPHDTSTTDALFIYSHPVQTLGRGIAANPSRVWRKLVPCLTTPVTREESDLS